MTKQKLLSGMVVENAIGIRFLVLDNKLFNTDGKSSISLINFNDNLENYLSDKDDIVKVYSQIVKLDDIKYTQALIWDKKEPEYEEMTIEEAKTFLTNLFEKEVKILEP